MSNGNSSLVLGVLPAYQRDFTLYVAVIKAVDLVRLCAGLRYTKNQEAESAFQQNDEPGDVKKLVSALSDPAFAREVIAAQKDAYDEDLPYQRIYDEARARSIASYLREEDAMLPNGIILATGEDVEVEVKAGRAGAELVVSWADGTRPFNIIDGQHRVEGLRLLLKDSLEEFRDYGVPATVLIDLPFWIQAQLFAVVNGRQKQVPRSRVYDLLGYLPMSDKETRQRAYEGEMALHRFCHHVVKVLNRSEKSPWKSKIKMRGSGDGIVTQAAMVDHLAIYLKPKKDRRGQQVLPVLYPLYRDSDVVGLAKILIIYFVAIQRAWPDQWSSEEALKKCLFGKTNGVAVVFQVLHNLIVMVGGTDMFRLDYVQNKWGKVNSEIIDNPPRGGSKGYQADVAKKVMLQMFGTGYSEQFADKLELERKRLLAAGGLI